MAVCERPDGGFDPVPELSLIRRKRCSIVLHTHFQLYEKYLECLARAVLEISG